MSTQPSLRPVRFGADILEHGVRFRLWSPRQARVSLVLDGGPALPMRDIGQGWREIVSADAGPGTRYAFRLADGREVPDPASRYQPSDAHGSSEVIDPSCYRWAVKDWRGRPWEECVIYELHIGAFTPQGTFTSAIERLGWLAGLGVTAIEIMPVADFPGARNWGYDGVLPFAPDSAYGRPEDLKALIDAAHALNIAMLLDVVYNHFGPEGNYLPLYAPIFTDGHATPWGAAVNYDGDDSAMVRALAIENAAYWIEEFRFDGLRLDAVHSICDDSQPHILDQIADRLRRLELGRPVHLLLENEENDTSRLRRDRSGQPIQYTAQWNDDVHHALHAAATGEASGYYADYVDDADKLGRSLAEGFAFQGEMMNYRGRARGQPSDSLPPTAFVSFIQNHDQVGNRALGKRLPALAPQDAVRAIAAVYLLLPQIPMIFMGEEFGASTPFLFFCDFASGLAKAVREGRRNEFSRFPEFRDPQQRDRIPDPTAGESYRASKLDWREANEDAHAGWVRLYRDLLAIRHREIVPRLKATGLHAGRYRTLGRNAVAVSWTLADGAKLTLIANLADEPLTHPAPGGGQRLWSVGVISDSQLGPWGIVWMINDTAGSA